jgi:hypothetical protein
MKEMSVDMILEKLVQGWKICYFTRIAAGHLYDPNGLATKDWFTAEPLLSLLKQGLIVEEENKIVNDGRSQIFVISQKGREQKKITPSTTTNHKLLSSPRKEGN